MMPAGDCFVALSRSSQMTVLKEDSAARHPAPFPEQDLPGELG
jgi:hypothetical protein